MPGKKRTQSGHELRKWIRNNPTGEYKKYSAEISSEPVSRAYFWKARKDMAAKEPPSGDGLIGIYSDSDPEINPGEAINSALESLTRPAAFQSQTDAGVILECAVKIWISKDSHLVQLDTVTNRVIAQYKEICRRLG